jgi:hypothetical protein
MNNGIRRTALLLAAVAVILVVPLFGNAAEDATNCVTSGTAQPTIPSGSTTQGLPDGGTVWAARYGSDPAGELGAKGAHGWLKISGSALTQSGRIEGRQTESGFSGYVVIGTSPKVCASVNGTKVKQP